MIPCPVALPTQKIPRDASPVKTQPTAMQSSPPVIASLTDQRWWTVSFVTVSLALAALAHAGLLGQSASAGLAFIAIAIALWHGAYDGVVGRKILSPRFQRRWWVVFITGYLVSMAAMLLLWVVAPMLALLAFLAYSAWHFGTGEQPGGQGALHRVGTLASGAFPLAALCAWHGRDAAAIFTALLSSAHASPAAAPQTGASVARSIGLCLWPAVAIAFATRWSAARETAQKTDALLYCMAGATALLAIRFTPILLGFALYFCLWHSPKHVYETSLAENGSFSTGRLASNLRHGLVPWVAALALLCLMLWLTPRNLTFWSARLFLLLSLLTVPHMLLHEFAHRSKGPAHPGEQS